MAYQAEISRKNPGCFLFLVDQSESMEDPFGGGEAGRKKAEELATILNKLIHNLCIRCSKSDSIYDYFHVGVLGRSEEHTSELQSQFHLVCRLLLEKKKKK